MPREIVLLCPTPPDIVALVEAGTAVDPDLGMRTLHQGAVHQLCRGQHADAPAVLSISQPLTVDNVEEVRRLLPGAAVAPGPLWWVEALAPWGADGETGVRVAYELAARLGGSCVVQDGT